MTNTIFNGTDAVMLSAETAVGQNPLDAIRFLTRCASIAETSLDYEGMHQLMARATHTRCC